MRVECLTCHEQWDMDMDPCPCECEDSEWIPIGDDDE